MTHLDHLAQLEREHSATFNRGDYEERVAIREYDAHLPSAQAEWQAYLDVTKRLKVEARGQGVLFGNK